MLFESVCLYFKRYQHLTSTASLFVLFRASVAIITGPTPHTFTYFWFWFLVSEALSGKQNRRTGAVRLCVNESLYSVHPQLETKQAIIKQCRRSLLFCMRFGRVKHECHFPLGTGGIKYFLLLYPWLSIFNKCVYSFWLLQITQCKIRPVIYNQVLETSSLYT